MSLDALQSLMPDAAPVRSAPVHDSSDNRPRTRLPLRVIRKISPSLVFCVGRACKQAFAFRAINKFNRTVVLQSKPLGGICDGHGLLPQEPLRPAGEADAALGCNPASNRCTFAEVEKAAQFITKLRQCSEQRIRSAFRGSSDHLYIVSRYIFRILLAFNQRSKIPSWHL